MFKFKVEVLEDLTTDGLKRYTRIQPVLNALVIYIPLLALLGALVYIAFVFF